MPFQARKSGIVGAGKTNYGSFNGAVPFQARKYENQDTYTKRLYASMGPCLFRHGNPKLQFMLKDVMALQWGRAFSGTEIYERTGFYRRLIRFNGAVPFQARKCPQNAPKLLCADGASMGPCLFRHGNDMAVAQIDEKLGGFNGAVPFQARKFWSQKKIQADSQLQWGRAFSGTEISLKQLTC